MTYVYGIILIVVNTLGLFLSILGLPGNWLTVAAVGLVAWWTWEAGAPWGAQMFHPITLIAVLLLAIVGEILEFFLGAFGSKQAGGSWWGAAGAVLGAIVGGILATFLIPIPVIGTLVGACLGAFAGAAGGERYSGAEWEPAMESGKGAAIGRFWGTVSKLTVGVTLWILVAVAAFVP